MSRERIKPGHLHDLAVIRATLLARRHAEEAAAEEQRLRAAAERKEREFFATSVGTVVPLRKLALPEPARPRPPAVARQRERDEQAALRESLSDELDVETLLDDELTGS